SASYFAEALFFPFYFMRRSFRAHLRLFIPPRVSPWASMKRPFGAEYEISFQEINKTFILL
ncbi:MAG: hypothetical protein V1872_09555, partial [bacterium]